MGAGLSKRLIPLELDGGINQKIDEHQLPPVNMKDITNGVFTKLKQLTKKYGSTVLPTATFSGGSITESDGLAQRNNELLQFSAGELFAYSETESEWRSRNKGVYPINYEFLANYDAQTQPASTTDIAAVGNIAVVTTTYRDYNGAYGTKVTVNVVDLESDTVLVTQAELVEDLGTAGQLEADNWVVAKCFALGNELFVVAKAGEIELIAAKIDTTDLVSGWSGAKLEDTSFSGFATLDVVVDTVESEFNIIHHTVRSANRSLVVSRWDTSFVEQETEYELSITTSSSFEPHTAGIYFDSSTQRLWCVHGYFDGSSTNTAQVLTLDSDLTLDIAATAIPVSSSTGVNTTPYGMRLHTAQLQSSSQLDIIYSGFSHDTNSPSTRFASVFRNASLNVISSPTYGDDVQYAVDSRYPIWLSLASKIYTLDGRNFVNLYYGDPVYQSIVTLEFAFGTATASDVTLNFSLAGRAGSGTFIGNLAYDDLPGSSSLPGLLQLDTNEVLMGGARLENLFNTQDIVDTGLGTLDYQVQSASILMKVRYGDLAKSLKTKKVGEALLIGGGYLAHYDGTKLIENNFFYAPQIQSVTLLGTGSDFPDSGTYSYAFAYRYKDSVGQTHLSPPSVTFQVTLNGSNRPQFVIRGYSIPSNMSEYELLTYRTDADGSVLYQHSHIIGTTSLTNEGFVGESTITLTDNLTTADTHLTQNPLLYTQGGVLANETLDFITDIDEFKNRIVALSDESNNILFSKTRVIGEPVNFNETLFIQTNDAEGDNTAVKSLDDKLIVFKKDSMRLVFGDGPDDTGANSTFSEPQKVQSAAGCSFPKAIASYTNGLIYKSEDRGWFLLDRSLSSKYIGAAVEDYNSSQPTSAVEVPNTTQIRFTLDNGTALVYDYAVDKWSVFDNISAVGATIWNDRYVWVTSAGVVHQEDYTTWLDNSAAASMSATTAWIPLAGLQGYQRVYEAMLLGRYRSGHTLTIEVGYDFEEAFSQTITINPTTDTTITSGDRSYQYRILFGKQKCEAIRFRITDTPDGTGDGRGLDLSGIQLTVGIKRGSHKLPASRDAV